MATEGGNVMKASDFFGSDADGVDKFKTVAMRALFDQKMEEELQQVRIERDRLQKENAALSKDVLQLKQSMATNIDDRERVLAFKSKRIEELLIKAKEYEAINTSLLQTISGSTELTEAGRNTRASIMLLERGMPLFHAVETCKEQEFKRLLDEKKQHCDQLLQQLADNDALVKEMQDFQRQKEDWAAQVTALEALVLKTTLEKDEKIHFLERKLVFEHDRLTREKESEVAAHKRDMEKQLTLQLDATTQRTIEENVRVQLELRYQSSQVERLIKQIDAVTAENRQVIHEKQLVDEMNALLSKKIKFFEQLFAKMQQHEQVKTKNQQRGDDDPASLSRVSPTRRKPPLPSLTLGSTIGTQSAFALSPPRSPSRGRDGEEADDDCSPLHLDMATIDLLGDQLNSVASEFDSHMQKREFTRKEVKAMLHYHDGSPRPNESDATTARRKGTKSKALVCSNSRGARKLRAAPLTLEAFIDEHATISPRNRSQMHRGPASQFHASPRLPKLPSPSPSSAVASISAHPQRPPPRATDSSALWKAASPTPRREDLVQDSRNDPSSPDQHALTARF